MYIEPPNNKIIYIEQEMESAYIDYAMSVIVSRALPDVRDGLKPVHRRVLYGMFEIGVFHNRAYKKSARIVGEVLGKYHPHGDVSVYDAMVRMTQEWALRYPLVQGQGNFGSLDGDSPAAMRYTEARLSKIAAELLEDIRKETVDFQWNFDDSLKEPKVLPSKFPNLLVNGSSGIAVGMATNIAPHNIGEVVDGISAYIENKDISITELMEYIKAPDFPTGGIIYGTQGVKQAFLTGKGHIRVRSVVDIETLKSDKRQIVITEIPYQVNKAMMVKNTADLVNAKKIQGITDIRDESDKDGVRIVYELRRDAISDVVINQLYKHTALESSFHINNVALVEGKPCLLNLKEMIVHYVEHRHEVLKRKTQFELKQAESHLHLLEGYLKALDQLDRVIEIIRGSKTPDTAKIELIDAFSFSSIQAKSILELRLQRLTNMEREKILEDYRQTKKLTEKLKEILNDETLRMDILKRDILEIKEKYSNPRRSEIVFNTEEMDQEDMIPNIKNVITLSHQGYVKKTHLTEFRQQKRGGTGARGTAAKEEDFIKTIFIANNHDYLLFFSNKGKLYWIKTYQIPETQKNSKGRPIQNLIEIEENEEIQAVLNTTSLKEDKFVFLCTKKGVVKKIDLIKFSHPNKRGIIAISLDENDSLLNAVMTKGDSHIFLVSQQAKIVRFPESQVRSMGRTARGVRGIILKKENDSVIELICIEAEDIEKKEDSILVVTEKGYGKRTFIADYRITSRGKKGVKTLNVTPKVGCIVAACSVKESDDLMIMTKMGITIRLSISNINPIGRVTQGYRLIRLSKGDRISSITQVKMNENSEQEDLLENDTI